VGRIRLGQVSLQPTVAFAQVGKPGKSNLHGVASSFFSKISVFNNAPAGHY
jgi:hypothetical protein